MNLLNVDWDGNELLLSDILGTDSDMIFKLLEDEIDRELLNELLDKLINREKTIIELRFGLKMERKKLKKKLQICLVYLNLIFLD